MRVTSMGKRVGFRTVNSTRIKRSVRWESQKSSSLKGISLPQHHEEGGAFSLLMATLAFCGGLVVWEIKGALYGEDVCTPFDIMELRRELDAMYESKPHLLQQAMRLHWIANNGFFYSKSIGGSTGKLDMTKTNNKEIEELITELSDISVRYEISNSDLWVLASSVAVQEIGGPDIDFRFGRKDSNAIMEHETPDLSNLQSPDEIRFLFYKMGLNDQEIVCLLGGLIFPQDAPFIIGNGFFKHVLNQPTPGKYPTQVVEAVRSDKMFTYWTQRYAADVLLFRDDFANAFSLLGHSNQGHWGPIPY